MTSPTVGSAKIEITGDLSKFENESKEKIKSAINTAADVVNTESAKITAAMGKAGTKGGEEFAKTSQPASQSAGEVAGKSLINGMLSGISGGRTKVIESIRTQVHDATAEGSQAAGVGGKEAGAKYAEKFSETAKETLHSLGKTIFAGVGALETVEIVKQGVEAADKLEGATEKVEGVFGESGEVVEKWSHTVAGSLRISASAAETSAGTFGQFLHSFGVGQEEAAGMSEKLVGLTQNIAKFNNADPAAVQKALTQALRGRATTMRQYGVILDSATISREALAHKEELGNITMKNGLPVLSAQQKGIATYYALMDQTTNQQGALKDSTNTLAQQQKIMSAEWENAEAAIGTLLLPILTKLSTYLTGDVVPAFKTTGTWIKQNETWLKPLVEVLGTAALVWKAAGLAETVFMFAIEQGSALMQLFAASTVEATAAEEGLDAAMDANPIGLLITLIAALVVGVIYAYKHFDTFRDIVNTAFSVMKVAVQTWWDINRTILNFALTGFMMFARLIDDVFVKPILSAFSFIVHAAADAFGWVPGLGSKLKQGARAFDTFKTAVNKQIAGIVDRNIQITANGSQAVSEAQRVQKAINSALANGAVAKNFVASLKANGSYPIGAPARALGGNVSAGHGYIVGEKRPEYFQPEENGRILPTLPETSTNDNGTKQMTLVDMNGTYVATLVNTENSRGARRR